MAAATKPNTSEIIPFRRTQPTLHYGGKLSLKTIQSQDPVLVKEGKSKLGVYRNLRQDPKVRAVLERRMNMVVDEPYEVLTGLRVGMSATRKDRKAVEMLKAHLDAMGVQMGPNAEDRFARQKFPTHFDGLRYGLLESILLSYAIGEIMWDTTTGEVWASEVRIRLQECFGFDEELYVRFFEPGKPALEGERLPPRKFLVYEHDSFTDPYGLSVGNALYWPVWFKRQGMTFWARFLDKYGAPTAVGKYPAAYAQDDAKKGVLMEAAMGVHSESAVIIPVDMELELLEGIHTASQQGFKEFETFLDDQISQAGLGVTLTTGIGSDGTNRAASDVHAGQQTFVARKDGRFLCAFLTNTLSRWTTDYNLGVDVAAPRIVQPFEDYAAMRAQAATDQIIFSFGYRPTLERVNEFYGRNSPMYEPVPQPQTQQPQPKGDDDGGSEEEPAGRGRAGDDEGGGGSDGGSGDERADRGGAGAVPLPGPDPVRAGGERPVLRAEGRLPEREPLAEGGPHAGGPVVP